jgi:hypothetical protein
VLNGIGGKTIDEAKMRISHPEFLSWVSYREKYGTLNSGMRTEWLMARLSLQISGIVGGKHEFADFMRYGNDVSVNHEDQTQAIVKYMARIAGG